MKLSLSALTAAALIAAAPWAVAQNVAIVNGKAVPTARVTALEQQIAAIWCEQLQVATVAADDHFFLLGGNSITATQVVARLRETLGLELNLRLLFEAPTLSAFAANVAQLQQDGGIAQGTIRPLSRHDELPQSLAQNRLWITWQLDPQSSAYTIPGALRLRGELDEDAVRSSFQHLIQRHEALRTRFYERDGRAFQRVDANRDFDLQVIDLSDVPVAEDERSQLSQQLAAQLLDSLPAQ